MPFNDDATTASESSAAPGSALAISDAALARLGPPPPNSRWVPDVLGNGFSARTLPLLPDDDGPVQATLVRADTPPGRRLAVLHLHGWNDYFHQRELAQAWTAMGVAFYGLDLRRYGRSLRSGEPRGYITDLGTYDEDIHAALRALRAEEGPGCDVVLMGHSTGGLIAGLWAHRHPGALRGLVLNSPWLELSGSWLARTVSQTVIESLARYQPQSVLPLPEIGHYSRALAGAQPDETPTGQRDDPYYAGWPMEEAWRVASGSPIRPGWLAAVVAGQDEVAEGLAIDCPVLVMASSSSVRSVRWMPEMRRADTVLDADIITRRALDLGKLVTVARFHGALHDVTLSAPEVRTEVYAELNRWARAYVVPDDDVGAQPAASGRAGRQAR